MGISMVFILLAGTYTVGTFNRNDVWKDSFHLWSDTARKSPDSPEAHRDLGLAYHREARWTAQSLNSKQRCGCSPITQSGP